MKAILIVMAIGLVGCAKSKFSKFRDQAYSDMREFREKQDSYKKQMDSELEFKKWSDGYYKTAKAKLCKKDETYGECFPVLKSHFISLLRERYVHAKPDEAVEIFNKEPLKQQTFARLEEIFRMANEHYFFTKATEEWGDIERRLDTVDKINSRNISCTSTRYGDTVYTNCN